MMNTIWIFIWKLWYNIKEVGSSDMNPLENLEKKIKASELDPWHQISIILLGTAGFIALNAVIFKLMFNVLEAL